MASSSEWTEASLGEVLELKRGYDLPKDKRAQGHVPIVSSSGVSDFHIEAMVKGPGVVTGRYGTIGEVFYVEEDYWPLNTTLYVRDFKGNDPRFISYFLKTLDFQAYSDKGAVPGINRNHLHLAKVRVPDLGTQRRIAQILSVLDNKIDLDRRINQTLESMAQAIFKSWFVDFDPVKAKLAAKAEGRDPLRAAMTAISGKPDTELDTLPPDQLAPLAATAALFPDEMEDSAQGEMPKGWAHVSAESLSDVGIGKTPPRKEPQWFTEESGDWRWVSIKDMGAGTLYQQMSSEYLTKEAVSRFNVRVVPDNTVLLSFKLTVGRVAISDGELLTNEAIAHFKLSSDSVMSSEYLYLYLKSFDFSSLGSTSSIADAVNSKTIRDLPVLLPSKELVARLGESVRPLFQEIRNRQWEVRTLTEARDALLPKLLSGEVEVAT